MIDVPAFLNYCGMGGVCMCVSEHACEYVGGCACMCVCACMRMCVHGIYEDICTPAHVGVRG